MILQQDSRIRLLWEGLIIVLIISSSVMTTYFIIFDADAFRRHSFWLIATDILFWLDMAFSFVSTRRADGVEIVQRRDLATAYLRGRFGIDLLANVPWYLLGGMATVAGIPASILMRGLRLGRLVRLYGILRRWETLVWSHPGILRIGRYLLTAALVMHWLACIWMWTAVAADLPPDSWVARADLVDADPLGRYTRALYWTVTTMTTVGYGDITPGRDPEYLLSILVMLLGASLYAFMIGNVASLFGHLHAEKNRHWQRMKSATHRLHTRGVSRSLTNRVRNYYEYVWARRDSLIDRELFDDLPEALRLEVMRELATEIFTTVPLFAQASMPLRDLLLSSMQIEVFTPGNCIARQGQQGNAIFFLTRGMAEIIDMDTGHIYGQLSRGDYFGELSVILSETRTASVQATDHCEALVLGRDDFDILRRDNPEFAAVFKSVAGQHSAIVSELLLEGVTL